MCASYQLGPPTFDHLPQVLDWIEGFAAGAAEGVAAVGIVERLSPRVAPRVSPWEMARISPWAALRVFPRAAPRI